MITPVVADDATCKQLQVAWLAAILSQHARSYNTNRSGIEYVFCRCGLEIRVDNVTQGFDLIREHAAHQAQAVVDYNEETG